MFNLGKAGLLILLLLLSTSSMSGAYGAGKSGVVPPGARRVSENVYYLGRVFDTEHRDMVEGYMIVHPKRENVKPVGAPGKTKTATCYGFLAKGAKWKSVEPWIVNPENPYEISDASVLSILQNGVSKWEDAADGVIENGVLVDILGNGSFEFDELVADTKSMDNKNEVYFDLLDEGTIGITIVWGTFSAPTPFRELREWDQVYNTFYSWSDKGDSEDMDFENIVTHELGHSVGLADLYTSACAEETMYGFSTEGEIKKQSLNSGDIFGISTLY